jgi:hypothetical protein
MPSDPERNLDGMAWGIYVSCASCGTWRYFYGGELPEDTPHQPETTREVAMMSAQQEAEDNGWVDDEQGVAPRYWYLAVRWGGPDFHTGHKCGNCHRMGNTWHADTPDATLTNG